MSATTLDIPYEGYREESRVPIIIGYSTFTLSVAFISVCLRIYSRAVVIKQFGNDDWASIIAFLFVFATGFCIAYNVENGFGRHFAILTDQMWMDYMRTFYLSIVFYNAALLAIKATFLLQFYRVFTTRKMRRIIIGASFVIAGWGISQVFIEMFICTPVQRFWDASVDGRCTPNFPQWYINAAGNIITDIAVFLIPLPIIWRLNLQRGQRMILLGIFCLGFFTCAISILRIQFLKLSEDATWDNVESAGWSIGELVSGLTCSCLPTFRPLLHEWCPGLTRTGRTTGYYYGNRSGSHATRAAGNSSNFTHHHRKGGGGHRGVGVGVGVGGGVGVGVGANGVIPRTFDDDRDDGCCASNESSFSDSKIREKFYKLPDVERQDSDEQFIMHGLQAPPEAVLRSQKSAAGIDRMDDDDDDSSSPSPRQSGGLLTGVRTEIVSTSPPGRYMHHHHMAEGAIRIERNITQTESPTGQYMYR